KLKGGSIESASISREAAAGPQSSFHSWIMAGGKSSETTATLGMDPTKADANLSPMSTAGRHVAKFSALKLHGSDSPTPMPRLSAEEAGRSKIRGTVCASTLFQRAGLRDSAESRCVVELKSSRHNF